MKHAGEDTDEDHSYGHARYETLATVANDVTVHIDPEDDEAAASCMDLPVRSEILATLNKAWSEHAILKNIDDVTLHYLDGHICVEACLPLTHLQRLEDADGLKNEFSRICSGIDSLGKSKLNFC